MGTQVRWRQKSVHSMAGVCHLSIPMSVGINDARPSLTYPFIHSNSRSFYSIQKKKAASMQVSKQASFDEREKEMSFRLSS